MSASLITLNNVTKSFKVGLQTITVLEDISLELEQGDFLLLFGPSGSGKSTLLHILLGLEQPTAGRVVVDGQNFYDTSIEDDRSEYRKQRVGMVFQRPNWIGALNVLDNVMFPLYLLDVDEISAIQRANTALARVGMVNWANHKPSELSSGQQQRVALARALITEPEIIVADEPTGNLDYESGKELMSLLVQLNREGKTILMVSHDLEYLSYAKTAVQLQDGRMVGRYRGGDVTKIADAMEHQRKKLLKALSDETGQTEMMQAPSETKRVGRAI